MYTSVTTSISRRPEPAMNAYEEQNIDPKDIDKVLNEVSALVLRFTAFRKFLLTHLHVRTDLSNLCHLLNITIYREIRNNL